MSAAARFRPGLWPTILTLAGLAVLVWLGVWQLDRLAWKRQLLSEIEERMSAPAVRLPEAVTDPLRWRYRRVAVTGEFLHERELFRFVGGKWHVITPLIRDAGAPVLMVRGWVDDERRERGARQAGLVAGPVTVTGVVRVPEEPGPLVPANDPQANVWYSVDPVAMATAAGLDRVASVLVDAEETPPGGWPKGAVTRVEMPNDHLEYALTWFSLAAVLAGIYVAFGVSRARLR